MVAQWKDDFPITGRFIDPTPSQTICGRAIIPSSASLFYYSEATTGNVDKGYLQYPVTGMSTANSPLEVGRGYSAFIRACDVPTIVDVTGPINQGLLNLPVTFTNTPDVAANGWNLVGNPYPATIDWDISGWTKTRISPVISIMDNGAGMMRYYDPGVSNDIPNGLIASGQAFFVRATAANPVLSIRENVKVTTGGEFFREGAPSVESFSLRFSNADQYDIAYVKLNDEALPGLDDFDAPKIYNPTFSFSTVAADQRPMAINALNSLDCQSVIPLEMQGVTEAGVYSIALNLRGMAGYRFVLTDRYLQTTTNLNNQVYNFEITAEAASKATDRFSVQVEEILPDETLVVSAPSILHDASTEYEVVLETSEKGVVYSLVAPGTGKIVAEPITGTGNAIAFPLAVDSLLDGENQLEVTAVRYCKSVLVGTVFSVLKDLTVLYTPEGEGQVAVRAYPNPVIDFITLDVRDTEVQAIEFATTMGQVLKVVPIDAGNRVYHVDFSNFGSGLYLMVVHTKTEKKSYRLIKK
jgi:hypothetical protein